MLLYKITIKRNKNVEKQKNININAFRRKNGKLRKLIACHDTRTHN